MVIVSYATSTQNISIMDWLIVEVVSSDLEKKTDYMQKISLCFEEVTIVKSDANCLCALHNPLSIQLLTLRLAAVF